MVGTVFEAPAGFVSATPIVRLLPDLPWPEEEFDGLLAALDRVVATDWSFGDAVARVDLAIDGEVALHLPGIDGLAAVLNADTGSGPATLAVSAQFELLDAGGWLLTLSDIAITLRWDSDLLVAMADDGAGGFVPTGVPFGIALVGSLTITDDWSVDLGGCSAVDVPPVQIGSTGIVISATDVRLDLSRTGTLPELEELGYGADFRGVYLGECAVRFPPGWGGAAIATYAVPPPPRDVTTTTDGTAVIGSDGSVEQDPYPTPVYVGPRLTLTGCAIGSGGISGDIAFDVTTVAPAADDEVGAVAEADLLRDDDAGVDGLSTELLGFGLALQRVELSLRRSTVTASRIDGSLRVPFVDAWFDVQVALAGDGAYEVSLALEDGAPLVDVRIEDVAELVIERIGLADPGAGSPAVVVSGSVTPLLPIGGGSWPTLALDELAIHPDGTVALPGGWITLPQLASADFFGFGLDLERIGFGTGALDADDDAEGWRWIGLSGTLRLVDELAMQGSVDGFKLAWRQTATGYETDWTLEAIGVAIDTDAFAFDGLVRFVQDETGGNGFRGAIDLDLKALGVRFDAQLAVGRTGGPDAFAYWGVILGVDLPFGIPLGPTGIALYGLAGVGMQNMAPTLAPGDDPYADWYRPPDIAGQTGVTLEKFAPGRGALGFGLGATLGTAPDNGFTVSVKALVLILFPGPTILIGGRAGFLAPRAALAGADEPPFEAIVVIDGGDGSVLAHIAAHYSLLDPNVLSIAADAEASFPTADPAAWYLHLGERPLEERIAADALSLFSALAYLDLAQDGIAAGLTVAYGDSYTFSPLHLAFDASISGTGAFSREPFTVRGRLGIAGTFAATAFGVGLRLAASADLTARAFAPLLVAAELALTVDLPTPLPSFSPSVHLEWRNAERPAYADPFCALRLVHALTAEEWEPATSEAAAPSVPLDARPVLTFTHALADPTPYGQPAACVLTPPPEQVGDDAVTYTLAEVALEFRPLDGGDWVAVDGVEGVWLLEGDVAADDPQTAEAAGSRSATKLELFGRTPFAYEEHATRTTLSTLIADADGFPCGPDAPPLTTCVDWQDVPTRTRYPTTFARGDVAFAATDVTEVAHEPPLGAQIAVDHALGLVPGTVVTATLPGPCSRVALQIESLGTATVEARATQDGVDVLLASRTLTRRDRSSVVFAAAGIERIVIRAAGVRDCASWSWQLGGAATYDFGAVPADLPAPGPGGLADVPVPPPIATVPCCTLLYGLCYRADAAVAAQDVVTTRRESLRDWCATWSGEAQILAPNTTYRLTASVVADGIDAPETITRTVYFRTLGPPGFLAAADDGKGAALADLGLYLDRTSPPSGAGLSLAAPPHYCAHDVVALFTRDYVKTLYAGQLYLELRDQNGVALADDSGSTLLAPSFVDPTHQVLTTAETIFVETLRTADCTADLEVTPGPSTSAGFTLPPLPPAELLRARLRGGWSAALGLTVDGDLDVPDMAAFELRDVLAWEFVTSRYPGFAEHLGSYDPARAFWDGAAGIATEADAAALAAALDDVGGGAWDEAERAAADALEGLLGIPQRVPPPTVELTVVRLAGDPVALLLDSPEPLDWSRITATLTDDDRGTTVAHVLVRLRDGRRALLLRTPDGDAPRPFRAHAHTLALDYDLAVAPARYRAGASGVEHAALAFTLAGEAV